jgi:putative transposase
VYLAVIIDVFSRMIVGWSLQSTLQKQLVLDTPRDAIYVRRPDPGLIFHSDIRSQYANDDVQRIMKRYGIQGSMSGRCNCYDNAISESFIGSLKTELVSQEIFLTRRVAIMLVFDYIEVFYNRQRIHYSIGNMSPFEYEQRMVSVVKNQLYCSILKLCPIFRGNIIHPLRQKKY